MCLAPPPHSRAQQEGYKRASCGAMRASAGRASGAGERATGRGERCARCNFKRERTRIPGRANTRTAAVWRTAATNDGAEPACHIALPSAPPPSPPARAVDWIRCELRLAVAHVGSRPKDTSAGNAKARHTSTEDAAKLVRSSGRARHYAAAAHTLSGGSVSDSVPSCSGCIRTS